MRRVEEEENHLVLLLSYFNLRTEDDSWDSELRARCLPKFQSCSISQMLERERDTEKDYPHHLLL